MKLKKIKLQLNKETIEVLNEMELNQVNGGSSFGCVTRAYEGAKIVFDAGQNGSFWNCADPGYDDYKAKSQWVGNNNPRLDNTAVTQGQYICVKLY
jgi:natural product precursor